MQACSATAHGIAHCRDSLILSDDTLVQFLFQLQQFLLFALKHAGYRDARPAAHHFSDIIGCNFFTHHTHTILGRCQLLLNLSNILFESL